MFIALLELPLYTDSKVTLPQSYSEWLKYKTAKLIHGVRN